MKLFALPLGLALAAALAISANSAPDNVKLGVGDPTPNFEGTWFNYDDASLAGLKGRAVFIEFWRTW
ncbi:MAG: hypothetical protein VX916_00755 [Planctomycetota bacterium]|nr:hypothetical protein [Planctomycetota bacterium]